MKQLAWHTRGCSKELQLALLTCASAIAELDPAKSKGLYTTARQQLVLAAESDQDAGHLLCGVRIFGGWGITNVGRNCTHQPPSCMRPCGFIRYRSTPIDKLIRLAIEGNPVPFYGADGDTSLLPQDIRFSMLDIGLVTPNKLSEDRIHYYISGLRTDILYKWVSMDYKNIVHLFKYYRHDLIKKLPDWYSRIVYILKIPDNFIDTIKYMIGWSMEFSPEFTVWLTVTVDCISLGFSVKDTAVYYTKRTDEYRKLALTWMLCGRGLVSKDVRRLIGQMVYDARLDFVLHTNTI